MYLVVFVFSFVFKIWCKGILVHTPNQLVAVMHHVVVTNREKNDNEEVASTFGVSPSTFVVPLCLFLC